MLAFALKQLDECNKFEAKSITEPLATCFM